MTNPFQPPRYLVVGICNVLDHDPGETFVAHLPQWQEEFLIAAGHLRKLPPEPEPRWIRLDDPQLEEGE